MGNGSRGFTLVELLVVLVIVGMVAVLAAPAVLQAVAERGTVEGATLLQAAFAGARDEAIHADAPRGFRLLPDPAFPAVDAAGTGIDPDLPLVANRWIPLTTAPDYSAGRLDVYTLPAHRWVADQPPPFPRATGHASYSWWPVRGFNPPYQIPGGRSIRPTVLCVAEAPVDPDSMVPTTPPQPPVTNEPTSWFWNVRVGDRLRIGGAGATYTVVGPAVLPSAEGFVNDGRPGDPPGLTRTYADETTLRVEYLFLVNGLDDDGDGFVDNGWDGVDNDTVFGRDNLDEWEEEKFPTLLDGAHNHQLAYTVTRRPVPASGTREVQLPSSVVIDLTTWSSTRERSRLPVDPLTGTVSIMVRPDGSIAFDSPYGVPTGLGVDSSFLHFWLADRSDVRAPVVVKGRPLTLPTPPELAGGRQLATVQARGGRFSSGAVETFDPVHDPANGHHGADTPFLAAQRGQP